MIVARSSRGRLLRREQRSDTLPFRIAQLPVHRRTGKRGTDSTRSPAPQRTACGMAAGGNRLVCPPPARPRESEVSLRVGSGHRQHQSPHFRHRQRDHAGIGAPFFSASSRRAAWRTTTKEACANRQSVTNRCHAVHVRTSY